LYIGGRFYGAEVDKFITLCEKLDENINTDEKNEVIAEWHDESHLNNYVHNVLKNNVKMLDIDYHVPQEISKKFKNISMIYLDKNKYLSKNGSAKDYKKCKNNTSGEIKYNIYNNNIIGEIRKIKGFVFKYTYDVGGLGDMIRGMVNCLVLSKIFNTKLFFEIDHPISQHFDYEKNQKFDIEINTVDFLTDKEREEKLNNFFENIFNSDLYKNKTIKILSNISFYEKLKTFNDFKIHYENSYKEIFNFFKPKQYLYIEPEVFTDKIVHIRFGDKYLDEAIYNKTDQRSGSLQEIKNSLIKVYTNFGKCKIVSDNTDLLREFGPEITEKFNIDTRKSIHFGYENTRNVDIVPTLQTFFDFKNYKTVLVNNYSGFSFLASLCFGLEYNNFDGSVAQYSQANL
jgi:hypothetical protein